MKVSLNMAISIDGKIATKYRGPVKLGSAYDTRRMAEIRAMHDLVVNGSSTFRAHPHPLAVQGADLVRQREKKGWPAQPISAVVSSRLDLPKNTKWEKSKQTERWVFCGKGASKQRKGLLEKHGVRVFATKKERPSPEEILRVCQEQGVKRVLLEGGGEFNASFLEKGLVDRLYITIVPILLGGSEAPTFFEGKGFLKNFPRFRLRECRNVRGELFLTYKLAY